MPLLLGLVAHFNHLAVLEILMKKSFNVKIIYVFINMLIDLERGREKIKRKYDFLKMIKVPPQIMTSYYRIANERPVYTVIDQW